MLSRARTVMRRRRPQRPASNRCREARDAEFASLAVAERDQAIEEIRVAERIEAQRQIADS